MLLLAVVGLPFVTAIACVAVPPALSRLRHAIAVAGAGATLLLALAAFAKFASVLADPQHSFSQPWIPAFGANLSLGLDGVSLGWLLVTSALTFVFLVMPQKNPFAAPFTSVAMLVCEGALLGIYTAQDMLLVWVFWALYLLAAFGLVAVRGGNRCWHAAMRFVIVAFTSLVMMLGVFLYVALEVQQLTGHLTFSYAVWQQLVLPFDQQIWGFAALVFALALSLPLLPFVGWWAGAHNESAPAGGIALLMGPSVFAFIKFALPLFPSAAHYALPWVSVVSVAGVLLAALAALQEPAFRRQVAWAAWAQTCLAVAGVASQTAQGIMGAIVLSGLSSVALAALLLCQDPSALASSIAPPESTPPSAKILPILFALSVAGLPGLGGFAAAFILLSGVAATLRAHDHHDLPASPMVVDPLLLAVGAALGVVLVGVALVRCVRRDEKGLLFARWDLRAWPLFCLAALVVLMGFSPQGWLRRAEATVNGYVVKHHRRVRHAVMSPKAPPHFYPNHAKPWAGRQTTTNQEIFAREGP